MKPERREHEWQKLYTVGNGEDFVVHYTYIDRCEHCRMIRNTATEPYWYMTPSWREEEPPCLVEDARIL